MQSEAADRMILEWSEHDGPAVQEPAAGAASVVP